MAKKPKGKIGSSFEDFLKDEGIYEEVTQNAETRLHTLMNGWAKKSDSKDFHGALLYAFAGYLLSHAEKNDRLITGFLGTIAATCDLVLDPLREKWKAERKNDPLSCSFCGKKFSEPKNNLVAGPDVFICRTCAKMIYEDIFKEHK